jgi:hypothetical protein
VKRADRGVSVKTESEQASIIKWQKKLLPFMVGMIAALTFFFFIASCIQLYYLHKRIENSPELRLDALMADLKGNEQSMSETERVASLQWRTSVALEGHVLQRRYHQANVLLMSRIWTRYLGFVTGMILALVGAVFILGKIRESESKLDAEHGGWKFTFTTASPGLVLALLGTILMITTMALHHSIEVTDRPVYLNAVSTPGYAKQEAGDVSINIDEELEKLKKGIAKEGDREK